MDYLKRKERLDYLLELLRKEKCNTIEEISLKFNVSPRTCKRMIAVLRNMGHQITYSKLSKKYFLEEGHKLTH